jgi:TetR/AcrR family transcriptional regulator
MNKTPTRQRRNAEQTREKILEEGTVVFAERGPDATTVELLARKAGVNRRMLYHYFGSKEGLYQAVIRRAYEELSSAEVELAHMLLPAEELLEKMIRAYYGFLAGHPEVVRLLTWENLRRGRAARELGLSTLKAPIIQALSIALERGRREGRFRRDIDERQLLISCMALSYFYFSNRHTLSEALGDDLGSAAAIERRVRHVLNLLLDGIRAGNGAHRARPAAQPVSG